MGGFYSEEYHDLVAAQRAITNALQPKANSAGELIYPDARDVAILASSLTRVVDQKRVMRGQPAPKPADSIKRGTKQSRSHGPGVLIDVTPQAQVAAPALDPPKA